MGCFIGWGLCVAIRLNVIRNGPVSAAQVPEPPDGVPAIPARVKECSRGWSAPESRLEECVGRQVGLPIGLASSV